MTVLTDTFTGTDSTTLVNHTATGVEGGFDWVTIDGGSGFRLDGNRLRNGSSGQFTAHRADRGLDTADQSVEIEVVSVTEGTNEITVGLIARKDSSATLTYYSLSLRFDNGVDTIRLFKKVNDSDTTLDSASVTWANGDVLRLTVEGTSLKGYQNETERVSATDATITSGDYCGLTRSANTSTPFMLLDNFAADIITSGGGGEEGTPMEVIQLHEETGSSTSASIAFNFPTTPTTGNLIVLVATASPNPTFTAPSGFVADAASTNATSRCTIMSKTQTTGNSFTVTRSVTGNDWRVVGYEIPPASLDVTDTSSDSGGGITSLALGPTTTTTFANAIAITGIRWSGNVSNKALSQSFTIAFDDNARQEAGHKILSTVGTVSTTWSWSNAIAHCAAALAVYGSEAAAGAAGTALRSLSVI